MMLWKWNEGNVKIINCKKKRKETLPLGTAPGRAPDTRRTRQNDKACRWRGSVEMGYFQRGREEEEIEMNRDCRTFGIRALVLVIISSLSPLLEGTYLGLK